MYLCEPLRPGERSSNTQSAQSGSFSFHRGSAQRLFLQIRIDDLKTPRRDHLSQVRQLLWMLNSGLEMHLMESFFVFWVVCISNIDSKCWKNPSWKWSHCLLKNREPVQIQSRFFLCIVPDIVMRRFILLFSLSPVMGIVPAGVWQVIQLPFDLWERSSDAGVWADSSLMTHSYGLLVEEGKKN